MQSGLSLLPSLRPYISRSDIKNLRFKLHLPTVSFGNTYYSERLATPEVGAEMSLIRTHIRSPPPISIIIVLYGVKPKKQLGPLYEHGIFRKMRWRITVGKQRDMAFLGNLIRRKFGPDPLIILGDKSSTHQCSFSRTYPR